MPLVYLPRYTDRVDPADPDPVQPHLGAGGDLDACPRCGEPTHEDREYCELCRDLRDEPLDTEEDF